MTRPPSSASPAEKIVLVLQGGGALGAYQAGAYEALSLAGTEPGWVAGISIGAINAAIICGNPRERRVARLREFWEQVSSNLTFAPLFTGKAARNLFTEAASMSVMLSGVPGFFAPHPSPLPFLPFSPFPVRSYYDTAPLVGTLESLVDFDYLNDAGPRISVGAVEVESGNFAYFDSRRDRIEPAHIMASGALPPGFPPVAIDGREYWDGGLVSNTPLAYIMTNTDQSPMCIFQVDLFSATGTRPETLDDVTQRTKDIQFSSRTRLTTDLYSQLFELRRAADRLADKLPLELRDDPDLAQLRNAAPDVAISLVHLIHRKLDFEGPSKDYEFSRLSMTEHWSAGQLDVRHALAHPDWINRDDDDKGLRVYDPGKTRTSRPSKGTPL
ncbi:patatin-like phospholipase family protein [Pseudoruegeria sp. SK021]|uniref:patatin-like phospholipase family protein n=1 Tax=Pseudoruegeria sp. SK021 TaxID=1933035 RepID=UPI000A218EC4|nr:patatin-like phospholipase family protein [Pseudoruegeria sp. SK021]OSP56627.1 hypothetical protein BV911_01330 [Pseudoruegeria sp. SK021]